MNTTIHLPPPSHLEFASPSSETLIAENTAAAAASAVGSLVRALAADRSPAPAPAPAPVPTLRAGGPPVDEVLRTLLRPLVKEWLDSQLPDLVERQVRGEVRRIVSQAA